MSLTSVEPLRGFSRFVREARTEITEQWVDAVFGDVDLIEADKLTYQQLADHLPEILDGLCAALELEDLEHVEPAIERDAREHGLVRWRQGYRIEEVVRELDLFHEVLEQKLEQFAEREITFTRPYEHRARRLISESLSMVTLTSVKEVNARARS